MQTESNMSTYGKPPVYLGECDFDLSEIMHYLYLPIAIENAHGVRIPPNLESCVALISMATGDVLHQRNVFYEYVYITARKGWASPDNPLNRPGWHCDGFGTNDLNYIWWSGPGTRFAVQEFRNISNNHAASLQQFNEQVDLGQAMSRRPRCLYRLDPYVVHSTPIIEPPGCMRQFVKISFSNHRYNLEDNSHNYLFDYDWTMYPRDTLRNDPHKAQLDYVKEG